MEVAAVMANVVLMAAVVVVMVAAWDRVVLAQGQLEAVSWEVAAQGNAVSEVEVEAPEAAVEERVERDPGMK